MEFKEWKPIYTEIVKDFGYSTERDEISSHLLDKMLDNKNTNKTFIDLKSRLSGRDVFVLGAGPSLLNKIDSLKEKLEKGIVIAADGATTALLEKKLIPSVIVTDLDGYVNDQIEANRKGSIMVIHAHGDNIELIKRYTPLFENIIGTTQTDPALYKNLYNFGGFTDGDRAIFLSKYMGAKRVFLVGFDFDGRIGKYSFTNKKKEEIKRRKLRWCRYLLSYNRDLITFI